MLNKENKSKHSAFPQRLKIIGILTFIVALGLASRKFHFMFPSLLGKYPGDALWAMMVFYLVLLLKPSFNIKKTSLIALAISYTDEFSQIYHQPHLDHFRATTIGHLILGSQFSWIDIVAYTIGIALVSIIEILLYKKKERNISPQS